MFFRSMPCNCRQVYFKWCHVFVRCTVSPKPIFIIGIPSPHAHHFIEINTTERWADIFLTRIFSSFSCEKHVLISVRFVVCKGQFCQNVAYCVSCDTEKQPVLTFCMFSTQSRSSKDLDSDSAVWETLATSDPDSDTTKTRGTTKTAFPDFDRRENKWTLKRFPPDW